MFPPDSVIKARGLGSRLRQARPQGTEDSGNVTLPPQVAYYNNTGNPFEKQGKRRLGQGQ